MKPTERWARPPSGGETFPLESHLQDVAERVPRLVTEQASTPDGGSLIEFVERLAWLHDVGKLTRWFQDYIAPGRKPPRGAPTHHAPLGGFLAAHVLQETNHSPAEVLAGMTAVYHHHGRLPDVTNFVADRADLNPNRPAENQIGHQIRRQVHDIDEHASTLAERIVAKASGSKASWSGFVQRIEVGSLFEDVLSMVANPPLSIPDSSLLPDRLYETMLPAWSTLVIADKTSAAGLPASRYEQPRPRAKAVDVHVQRLQREAPNTGREKTINELRERARTEVLASVEGLLEEGETLATITLPTGLGKTLTGLQAGLRIAHSGGSEGRLVYVLPYTSIIDQVASEAYEVFEASEEPGLLTIHHHLSDPSIRNDSEDTDERADLERVLGSSWRAGLTITTFVQLFESLAGPRNTQSMKLPALHDSVIVLDEPQTLPPRWWKLVHRLVSLVRHRYDATVVVMTATQPRIFREGGEGPIELVPEPTHYFDALDRVTFEFDDSLTSGDKQANPISYEAAAVRMIDGLEGRSALAVCNTIDAARSLTEAIESHATSTLPVGSVLDELLPLDPDPSVLAEKVVDRLGDRDVATMHLTTRVRPRDRLLLVKAAKELAGAGIAFVTVSTQLIEAGVDVSFDHVYRDLAPMDSIVQAAGRCNRSFETDQGLVTVWWLEAPGGLATTPAEAVYARQGDNLLRPTLDAIEEVRGEGETGGTLSESEVTREAVEEYYRRFHERDPGDRSLVDHLENGRFERLGEASLIDQRRCVELLVQRTDHDERQIQAIREAYAQEDHDALDDLMRKAGPIRVSIPIYGSDTGTERKILELPFVHPDLGLRYLDTRNNRFGAFFMDDTAEVRIPGSTVEARIL